MISDNRSTIEQLPDLPGLETIEAGPREIILLAGVLMGFMYSFLAGVVWFVWKYRPYLGEQLPLMYGFIVILGIASLWMTARLLFDDHHWRTTPDGLSARSFLRKRFVRWGDVQQASSRRSSLCSMPAYDMRTRTAKFHIHPVRTYSMLGLYASIQQHLRRVGKADGLVLPDPALSIWDRIPNELPKEMDWTDLHPSLFWPNAAITALFTAGPLWLAISEALDGLHLFAMMILLIGSILPLIFGSVLKEMMVNARKVSLREDKLEAVTRRGTVTLPWDDVTHARWGPDANSGGMRIVISGGTPCREVGILYKPSSEESPKLMLAIIRRLRTAGVPQSLAIPVLLRSDLNTSAVPDILPQTQPVVLRLTWSERLGAGFFPGVPIVMLISLLFVEKLNPNPWHIIVPCAAAYVIGFILSGSYQVCADANGVSKRFMFWAKSVTWHDITGYSVSMPTARSTITKRLLCENGKAVMNIAPYVGTKADQERFLAYVHAKLAEVLPRDTLNPPWKARPWTPS